MISPRIKPDSVGWACRAVGCSYSHVHRGHDRRRGGKERVGKDRGVTNPAGKLLALRGGVGAHKDRPARGVDTASAATCNIQVLTPGWEGFKRWGEPQINADPGDCGGSPSLGGIVENAREAVPTCKILARWHWGGADAAPLTRSVISEAAALVANSQSGQTQQGFRKVFPLRYRAPHSCRWVAARRKRLKCFRPPQLGKYHCPFHSTNPVFPRLPR